MAASLSKTSRLCVLWAPLWLATWVQAQGDYQRGVSYYKQGQYAKAVAEFEPIVRANPSYEDGHRLLGDSYLRLKRYDDAIQAFQKAVQLNGNNFVSQMGLALAYFNTGRYRDAVATLLKAERLARSARDQYQLYHTRGAAYFNIRDFERSLADLQKAVTIQRGNTQDILQIGICHFRLGNATEAENYLRQALALDPNSSEAKDHLSRIDYTRAVEAIRNKNYEQAVTLLKEYVAENPPDGGAWFNLGLAYLFSNNLKSAEEAFLQTLNLTPGNWEAHDRLGYIYEKSKNYGKALERYQKAVDLSQNPQAQASVERVQERIRRQRQGRG